ncbi:MAG: hypothetical protein E7086_02425 [Bacteroidales bacterium]|nr:hypothetical protein [Bacteroidales bacterium]
MRAMKDSGIPWIGEIPEGWKVCKTKDVFVRKNEKAHQENPIVLSLARAGVKVRDITKNEGQLAESYYDYNPVEPFDLLLNPMDLYSGANCSISLVRGVISPAYVNLKAKANACPRFYDYYYKTQYWSMAFFAHGKGISFDNRWTLGMDTLFRYNVPLPPLAEQQRIAEFLDRKCAEVDEMIALQEQIIEELKAYKQSVITETVTKGLNPDVPMKDSGIEWIGQIPEHWEVEPLKYNFNRRSERNNPIITTERLSLSIDKGVTLYSEKTTNLDRFKEDFTQYQLAYPNDIVLNCMNMIVGAVGLSKYLGCVSPVYYVIYPFKTKVDSEYYSYLLNTSTIRGVYYSYGKGIYAIERGEGRVNTCRLKVSYDDFGRFNIPIPPIEEQRNIVSHIKEKCADIDALIATKQQKIDSLKEYKKSIIYEYVTGKKEVTE